MVLSFLWTLSWLNVELEISESSFYHNVDEVTPKNLFSTERMKWEKKAKNQTLENFNTDRWCERGVLEVTEKCQSKRQDMSQKKGQVWKVRKKKLQGKRAWPISSCCWRGWSTEVCEETIQSEAKAVAVEWWCWNPIVKAWEVKKELEHGCRTWGETGYTFGEFSREAVH